LFKPGCRRRRAWVPDPPASPVTRDPPGGARTVLRLRPLTLDLAPTRPCSSTRTRPLGPVLDARVPGFARAVQGELAALGAPGAPGLHCEPLAESPCGVVPGSPVIRWKWSPAWPVATAATSEFRTSQNYSTKNASGHVFVRRRGTNQPDCFSWKGNALDENATAAVAQVHPTNRRRATASVRVQVALRARLSRTSCASGTWSSNSLRIARPHGLLTSIAVPRASGALPFSKDP
jgi:hypothetical protein